MLRRPVLVGLLAVSLALGSGFSSIASAAAPQDAAGGDAGASIYGARCATCHRANGLGAQGGVFPALAGNANVTASDSKEMLGTICRGRNMMPGWRERLSPGEIAAVATFIRSAWGNKAGPVSEEDVASVK